MSKRSTTRDVLQISGGYEPLILEQFADRRNETLLIQRRVEAAQKSGEIEYPLVEFFGVVGQGKSWLLSYLAHQYWFSNGQGRPSKKPTLSAKIEFDKFRTSSDAFPLLHSLTSQIKEQLVQTESDLMPPSLPEDIEAAARGLSESMAGLTKHYVPVLTFDATEQADEELLDWVEKELVYPIIRTNRALFIFSGRLWHRWKIFEVRRRVEPLELLPLDPQKGRVEGTTGLLTKLGVDQADSVARVLYDYAFGHPLASKVIFKELQELAPEGIDAHVFEGNQDAIAEIVRTNVIKDRFFGELGEHNYLNPLLWAICILRKFNPTPLRHFTASFIDGEYEQKLGGFYLDAIRDMQDTTLVQWNSAAGGYTLDPVVRKIMAKNLSMRDDAEFQRRHAEAVRLYDDWIEQFPRNAVGFLIERTFHRSWELRDGKSQPEIGDRLVSEFDQILRGVEKHPDVQWDLPDMAAALNEELNKDSELREVVSKDTLEKLKHRADKFREKFRGQWA